MSPTIFFFSNVLLLDDILAPKVILYDLLKEWMHSGHEYFPVFAVWPSLESSPVYFSVWAADWQPQCHLGAC